MACALAVVVSAAAPAAARALDAELVARLAEAHPPDGDLLCRAIEVDVDATVRADELGPRHPDMMRLVARRDALREAVRAAPAGGPEAPSVLRRCVARLVVEAQRATVAGAATSEAAREGPRSLPGRLAARRVDLLQAYAQLASVAQQPSVEDAVAQAYVDRAVARGMVAFARDRYGDAHPSVVAARATLAQADALLASAPVRPDCAYVRLLFELTLARVQRDDYGPNADDVIDALVVDRAEQRAGTTCVDATAAPPAEAHPTQPPPPARPPRHR